MLRIFALSDCKSRLARCASLRLMFALRRCAYGDSSTGTDIPGTAPAAARFFPAGLA